jgi:hypothetical protein
MLVPDESLAQAVDEIDELDCVPDCPANAGKLVDVWPLAVMAAAAAAVAAARD